MSAQLEDAWKEYERTGEICNSAEGLLTHCAALTEHLRLKEEECKKFQNDKEELVEALRSAIDELIYFYTQESFELCDVDIEAKNLERLAGFSKLLEKHKCD